METCFRLIQRVNAIGRPVSTSVQRSCFSAQGGFDTFCKVRDLSHFFDVAVKEIGRIIALAARKLLLN